MAVHSGMTATAVVVLSTPCNHMIVRIRNVPEFLRFSGIRYRYAKNVRSNPAEYFRANLTVSDWTAKIFRKFRNFLVAYSFSYMFKK